MPIDDAERRANWERLMPKRREAVLEKLRILGNLSSAYSYAYEPAEIEALLADLRDEIDHMEVEFVKGLRKQGYE